jgi:hypothetical protein
MVGGFAGVRNQGRTDIAREHREKFSGVQNVLDKRRGSRFSIGASDTEHLPVQKVAGQLDFAPDLQAKGTRFLQ